MSCNVTMCDNNYQLKFYQRLRLFSVDETKGHDKETMLKFKMDLTQVRWGRGIKEKNIIVSL